MPLATNRSVKRLTAGQQLTRPPASRVSLGDAAWLVAALGLLAGCSAADGFGAEALDGNDSTASTTTSGPSPTTNDSADTTASNDAASATALQGDANSGGAASGGSAATSDDTTADTSEDTTTADTMDPSDFGFGSGTGGAGGSGESNDTEDSAVNPTTSTSTGGQASGGAGATSDTMTAGGAAGGSTTSANSGDGGMSSMMTSDQPNDFGEMGIMRGMTAAHNAVRAEISPDDPLPELAWSQDLADYAQDWADTLAMDCQIEHRDPNDFGENIATFGASPVWPESTIDDAVDGWAAEIMCWEYGTFSRSDSCDSQCVASLNANGCGHYTQLVWRESLEVGCGFSTCTDSGFNWEIWVCNYDPPGNWVGELPY